ncbi:MAG TPA: Fe-S cluster assembly protein HesB [Chloroflexota bacterium]|nr:Fe-S cluster assembly protein HesB [Chloroflexota bacterium]
MPKLERLEWIAPPGEGRGVTLTDDPAADLFLAENANALLLGVLYDSQYSTRRAFAIPLRLKERLGHFEIERLAAEDNPELVAAFSSKPALHRFPYRYATLTSRLAAVIVEQYGGDAAGIWRDAADVEELGRRLMALPAFGVEKTNWTVGMLGRLDMIDFPGWETYRAPAPRTRKPASQAQA